MKKLNVSPRRVHGRRGVFRRIGAGALAAAEKEAAAPRPSGKYP